MSNNYDIDDILSELKQKKGGETAKPEKSSGFDFKEDTESKDYAKVSPNPDDAFARIMNESVKKKSEPQADFNTFSFSQIDPNEGHFEFTEQKQVAYSPPASTSKKNADKEDFFSDYADNQENQGDGFFAFKEPKGENPNNAAPFAVSAFESEVQHQQAAKPEAQSAEVPNTREPQQGQPLDFHNHGHVRPITDRAKMRDRYLELAKGRDKQKQNLPPVNKLQFHTDKQYTQPIERATQTQPIPSFDPNSNTPANTQASRSGKFATMANATGKSLKIEDIKRMDFESVPGAGTGRKKDVYYADQPSDGFKEGSLFNLREFRPNTDRRDISREIAQTKVGLFIKTALTLALTVVLTIFTLSGKYGWIPMPRSVFPEGETAGAFLVACTIITGVIALVNIKSIISGIFNMLRMRGNSESLAALAIIAAIVQGIIATRGLELVDLTKLNLYFPVAGLVMFFLNLGRLTMIGRIQENFKIVSSKLSKKGVMAVESDGFCYDLVPENTENRPTITYATKAEFFTDFLSLSFSDRYDVGFNRSVAPVCFLGAAIVAVGAGLAGGVLSAMSAFTAVLCICATLSVTFIESIPLRRLSKKLAPYGGMVSGNKAVENFCDTHSVIVNDTDLFPEGSLTLLGIKAFPDGSIHDAILDAASVLCEVGGALGPLFLDMIGGKTELLKKVDSIVYENGMGVSAWVNKKRILIGNRMLMQTHGVMLPNDTYERENQGNPPNNPIYISNSGEVSARFLVSYNIVPELAEQLDSLAAHTRHLVVYTNDANINEQKVWETYGYPLDLISILPSDFQSEYKEFSEEKEDMPAEIVYTGGAENYIACILGTIAARSNILSATVVQLIQIVLGYGLLAFMAFMGFIGNLTIIQILAYQGFWLVAILLVQLIKRN